MKSPFKLIAHKPPAKLKAVLYARVSSKEQEEEGFSTPAQRKLLLSYAASKGFDVVEEFVEAESAKRAGRKAFNAMVEYLRTHPQCRIVLVEKVDRLYRNFKDPITLDELDIETHFVKEGTVLSKTSKSQDQFIHDIKIAVAKNYITNLGEEAKKGMQEKAEEGMWPSQAPLGYLNVDGPDKKRTIRSDPERAMLIVRTYEEFATAKYSLKDVAKFIYDAGLRSRKGNRVPKATIHNILRNRLYMGEFEWNGRVFTGKHTPLVSRELWEKVQAILDRRFDTRHRQVIHDFAFSRLITCGHCGCSLVGELKKSRYVYYRCTHYKQKCPEKYVREELLEEAFTRALEALVFDDEVLAWISQALRESHQDEQKFHDEAVAKLQAQYNALQKRIDVMYTDRLDGRIDAAFFDRMAGQCRKEQDDALQAMQAHQKANRAYLNEGVALLELAKNAAALFQKQPAKEKRRLLDFVLSNCTWKDATLSIAYRQPFDTLVETARLARMRKAAGEVSGGPSAIWLPFLDAYRTLCLAPPAEIQALFETVRGIAA